MILSVPPFAKGGKLYFWLVPKLLLGSPCFASSSLFVDRSSGSWSFKDSIPKLELGNEQNVIGNYLS